MKPTIKILVVDDEILLLESLSLIFSLEDALEVIGTATDGIAALQILEHQKADIALVDLNMDGMNGIALIAQIKELYPWMKLLVLTTFYDEKNIIDAIAKGADGYLLKDSGRARIIDVIYKMMQGNSILDYKVMHVLTEFFQNNNPQKQIEPKLQEKSVTPSKYSKIFQTFTKRELDICQMIAEGYNNSQISSFLGLSKGTTRNYVSNIYSKLEIHDRALLAVTLSKELENL